MVFPCFAVGVYQCHLQPSAECEGAGGYGLSAWKTGEDEYQAVDVCQGEDGCSTCP